MTSTLVDVFHATVELENLENNLKVEVSKLIRETLDDCQLDFIGGNELDIYGLVQDELSQMDMLDYMDTSTLEDKIGDVVDHAVSQLTIERNK